MNVVSYIIMMVYTNDNHDNRDDNRDDNLFISFKNEINLDLLKVYKSSITKYNKIIISQYDSLS